MTLPSKAKRASKVLGFDSGGLPVALSQLDKSADTVTAIGSTTPRSLAERAGDFINVLDYGAVPGSGDNTAAFQAAHDALSEGDVFFVPRGTYLLRDFLWTKSHVWIVCVGRLDIYDPDSGDGSVIQIGDKDNLVVGLTGNLRVGDEDRNFTNLSNTIKGVEVVNLSEAALHVTAPGLTYGFALHPAADSGSARVAYCEFHLGNFARSQFGLHIDPKDALSWANENNFYGGKWTQFSSVSAEDAATSTAITVTNGNGNVPNNNIFYKPSLEGTGKLLEINGVENRVYDARFEPSANANLEALIELGSNSRRNSVCSSYSAAALTDSALSMEHTGTFAHVDESRFSIDKDVRGWCFPGAVIRVTVTGNVHHTVTVARASFAGGTTTIQIAQPIFEAGTAEAIGMRTPKLVDAGRGNVIVLPNTPISGSVTSDAQMERRYEQLIALMRSALTIQGIAANYPAITLLASASSAADPVLRVLSSTGDSRFTMDGNGNLVTGALTPRTNAANSIGTTSLRYINAYLSGLIGLGSNIVIRFGADDPEGNVVGFGGSLYFRYDSVGEVYTAYIKKTQAGNTGWEEITTS